MLLRTAQHFPSRPEKSLPSKRVKQRENRIFFFPSRKRENRLFFPFSLDTSEISWVNTGNSSCAIKSDDCKYV